MFTRSSVPLTLLCLFRVHSFRCPTLFPLIRDQSRLGQRSWVCPVLYITMQMHDDAQCTLHGCAGLLLLLLVSSNCHYNHFSSTTRSLFQPHKTLTLRLPLFRAFRTLCRGCTRRTRRSSWIEWHSVLVLQPKHLCKAIQLFLRAFNQIATISAI